jgi:hypothetical protein
MYVVTWIRDGRKTWERAASKALAITMAERRGGSWAYVAM